MIVITIFAFIIPKKRILNIKLQTKVIINSATISYQTIGYGYESPIKTMSFSKIKKIVDYGDWYDIIFKHGGIYNSWVCQKNLIVEGKIEDFEKLFKNKIIKDTHV